MSSAPSTRTATALWYVGDGKAAHRSEPLPVPGAGEVMLQTLFSGVSRGTERLVFEGRVPIAEHERMRGPAMGGTFPFPVKYGYCAVGRIEQGPSELVGREAFLLHPHQDRIVAPVGALTLLPEGLPARRATLSANMETALNALWDSGALPGDRIAVVGGGVVGALIAGLAAQLPGAEVTLVDPEPARKSVADALHVGYAMPAAAPVDCDVVFHASATEAGLATALASAGFEGTIVEVSWFGSKPVAVPLGGAFHSRRLRLISSQVGHVAGVRRARWDYARRMAMAMALLKDARFDALLGDDVPFAEAPARLPPLLTGGVAGLAPVLSYA